MAKPDVLDVLDDEIRALPEMAGLIRRGEHECDETLAVERLKDARERIAELITADVEYDEAVNACDWTKAKDAQARRRGALAACRGLE